MTNKHAGKDAPHHIKITMQHHYTTIRMVKIQNPDKPNAGEDVEHGSSHSLLLGMQMVQPLWKSVWWFFTEVNITYFYHKIQQSCSFVFTQRT